MDLFGTPEPPRPNIRLHREWRVGPGLLAILENGLAWEQRSMARSGNTVNMPRLECFYSIRPGAKYRYSGVEYVGHDISHTPILWELIGAVSDRARDDYGVEPNAVFANWYRTGQDSIGWHSDDEPALGPRSKSVIASLSLGARRRFVMKHYHDGDVRHEWSLGRGDLLIMGPGCQSDWLHSVPKTSKPVGSRINLTFRRLV